MGRVAKVLMNASVESGPPRATSERAVCRFEKPWGCLALDKTDLLSKPGRWSGR
jgi:hypothetical protein